MSENSESPRLTRGARITGIITSIVLAVAILGTLLVVSPEGTPLRSTVRSATLPYFGQTWRVFAPNILKSNRTFELRAQWRDDSGELVTSGWVSITDIEQRGVGGNSVPANIRKASWNASGTYQQRYNALDGDQRERVRDTFIEASGDGFRPIPVEDLVEDLGEGDADVIRFLRMDYMLMRYTTLYATAGFDKEIERVQWRVISERPNDFSHRFEEDPQFEASTTTFGWRQSDVAVDEDILSEYRGLIERFGALGDFQEAADEAQ